MSWISGFFSLLLTVTAPLAGHDSDAARNLLLRAQLADARSDGGETFRVNAKFTMFNDDKQIGTGNYELVWTSTSKWREKVSTTDFSQLRMKDGDGIWETRQPAYQSLRVWQLMQALAFSNRLNLWKDESVGSIKTQQKNGVVERCVEVKLSGAKLRDLCFNDVSELLSEHYIPSDRTYEFTNYTKIGAKTFPGEIKVYDGKKLAAEFSVTEIEPNPTVDSLAFVRPPDAKWRKWCANPEPAFPLPTPIVVNHPPHEWHVTLFGTIGTDGRWHDLYILESGGAKADAFVLDELKNVRFKPATCDGVPVTAETAFRR
ncbi:MAG TPA: hypothetical protein VMU05_01095 [Dongiaceae bacterium]|nr:hypothetical protein [Dongiaceae bacterium]